MTDKELNSKISEIEGSKDLFVEPITNGGKIIPYLGWWWREVNFSKVVLGFCNPPADSIDIMVSLGENVAFVGFMENNKWGYSELYLTPAESGVLKQQLEAAVTNATNKKLQFFYDSLQHFKNEQYEERWTKEYSYD